MTKEQVKASYPTHFANREQMIEGLVMLQNNKEFCNQDIMTITGFMKDDNEVWKHYVRCYRQILNNAA
jgi:hypothetical protein